MSEEKITIVKCDDGAIWITSDQNPVGIEARFENMPDDGRQELIALAEFFGFEPASIFCFDD